MEVEHVDRDTSCEFVMNLQSSDGGGRLDSSRSTNLIVGAVPMVVVVIVPVPVLV